MQKINLYSSAFGNYPLQVVGEESYQDEIRSVIGIEDDDSRKKFREDGFSAELIFEDNNIYDRGNAIRVDVEGKTVGYLSKADARKYREGLAQKGISQATSTCYAAIAGRYNEEKSSLLFGVWLDIDLNNLIVQSVVGSPASQTLPKDNLVAQSLIEASSPSPIISNAAPRKRGKNAFRQLVIAGGLVFLGLTCICCMGMSVLSYWSNPS